MPGNLSRVQLVRCPKCGHLLPELPQYSVYCCGGCGAFLRAERNSSLSDDLSEKSGKSSGREDTDRRIVGVDADRDNGRRSPIRVRNSPMRSRFPASKSPMRERNSGDFNGHGDPIRKSPMRGRNVDYADHHGNPTLGIKSPGRSTGGDASRSPLRERAYGPGKSPPLSVRGGVARVGGMSVVREGGFVDPQEMKARDKVGAWFDHVKEEVGYSDKLDYQDESFSDWLPLKATTMDQTEGNGRMVSPRRLRQWDMDVPSRPDHIAEECGVVYDRRGEEVPYDGRSRRPRGEMKQMEGQMPGFRGVHGNKEVPSVRRRYPVNSYDGPSDCHPDSYYGYDEPQSSHSHYREPVKVLNAEMHRAELLQKYKELGEEIHRWRDQRIPSKDGDGGPDEYINDDFLRYRRGTVRSPGPSQNTRMRVHRGSSPVPLNFVQGRNEEDINDYLPSRFRPYEFPVHEDPYSPQMPGMRVHHQARYHDQQPIPRRYMDARREHVQAHKNAPTADLVNERYAQNQTSQAPDPPDAYRNRALDPAFPYPTQNSSSLSRSSGDSKSDGVTSARDGAKKVLAANKNQQLCHPILGGAPFLICRKCFHLLRLPKKIRALKKKECSMQCGSCSTVLSFNLERNGSHTFVQMHSKAVSTDEPREEVGIKSHESFDLHASGYTFQRTDSEPSLELEDRRLNTSGAKKRPSLSSSSSQASKDDLSDATADQSDTFSEAGKPKHNSLSIRPPPGSPLRDQVDYTDTIVAKNSEANKGEALRQDEVITRSKSTLVNHVETVTVPADLELNSDELLRTESSHSSADASMGKDQGGSDKVSGFSFAFMERGFQDSSSSILNSSHAIVEVYVNGKPITPDAVRRAEKKAGPVSPGDYWYDSRAGFWGVMGQCCLGIIPPFIEEFGTEMPENCSGGETCTYVNGRELHEDDIDILCSRGLPRSRYRYYLVDRNGKVEDADTGDFVVSLGKLAPTVEKRGYGFGMQP